MSQKTDTVEKQIRSGVELASVFGVRSAAEWIDEARQKPLPRCLFGEFWKEGELAVLFSDTGKGKSILAVQLADALARGAAISPMRAKLEPQKVLYLDCELTEKQFEMRYAPDAPLDRQERVAHYSFSPDLYRAQIDVNGEYPEAYGSFAEYLQDSLADLVRHFSATILIVDNISILKRSNESEAASRSLMRELKRLKTELGISILVLAHTPKRPAAAPLTLNDLAGFKAVSNFADTVFSIGQSSIESDVRYVKHLKQRSAEMQFDERCVPTFRIIKRGGNFLSFEFLEFTSESVHLFDYKNEFTLRRMAQIHRLAGEGLPQRAIASELKISVSSVNKYMRTNCIFPKDALKTRRLDPATEADYFEGCDEIDKKLTKALAEYGQTRDHRLRVKLEAELKQLHAERVAAQREYWIATGKIPKPDRVTGHTEKSVQTA